MVIGFHTPHTVARLVLDTCDVIERWKNPEDYKVIEILYQGHRVFLAKTDVVDTELDPEKNIMIGHYFLASIDLLELHGPCVTGHSRLDHTLIGGDDDWVRFDRVKKIIGIRDSSERNEVHDLRDAMHISTAIRYGFDGFITGEKRLLGRASQLLEEFNFRIFDLSGSVEFVMNRIQHQNKLQGLNYEIGS